MLPFPAASRRALRLDLAASSGTPLALRATACSAPLSPPERTRRAARHVTPHHIASELLDRNNLRMDLLVRIDQRNPCTLSGVARRRVTRQGYPCTPPLRIGRRKHDNTQRLCHNHLVTNLDDHQKAQARRGTHLSEMRQRREDGACKSRRPD